MEVLGSKGLVKKHEFIRIMVQCLYSLGFKKSASCLENESNVMSKSDEFAFLEMQVLSGDWDGCLGVLDRIFDDYKDDMRNTALYLVFKQCLFEYLKSGDASSALNVLRKQAPLLRVGKEKIHRLACDIISSKEMESGELDECLVQDLRKRLLVELETLIPSPIVIPERRLEHLVETAVMDQIDSCLYHNSWDAVSLYRDHHCGRDQIPSETVQILMAHKNEVWFVQFSNNGKYLATASSDCTAIIWKVVDLAVTPDGESMITVFSDKEIRILHLETKVERVISEEQPITSLSISANGKFFIVNLSSQEIHLWDLAGEWKQPLKFSGHKQSKYVIRSCFGGLDSSFIASGSENSQVYIWNLKNAKPLEVLSGHSMTVNCVSWNPINPRMLASASDDQTIRIWGPAKPNNQLDNRKSQ